MAKDSNRWANVPLVAGFAATAVALVGFALADGARRYTVTGGQFPGMATSIAQILGSFAGALLGAITLGALVHIVTTARPDAQDRLGPATFRVHLLVERTAPLWVLVATAMAVISSAGAAGKSALSALGTGTVFDAIAADEQSRGWCAAAVFALLTAVGARFTLRWIGHLLLLVPAGIAVMAVPVTGNPGQGPDHDVATSAAMVFAVSLAVLVGGKVAATVSPPPPELQRRVRLLHGTAATVAVLYAAILAPLMVAGTPLLGSDYGRLLTATAVALVVLWCSDIAGLLRGLPGSRWNGWIGALGIAVIGAVSLLAVLPPPRFLAHRFTAWDVFLGYQLHGPANAVNLLTVWRFDPLIGTAAVVMAVGYLTGVWVLRRRGDDWPVGRTASWTLGALALLLASSSGVRAYGSAMFSVHMGEHMALNMFVPVLLVLGAPVTLLLRTLPAAGHDQPPGPREWVVWFVHAPVTRFLSHPVTAFVLFVGSLYAVYFTPLFDTLVRYHWGHEFMSVHFLLTGYLFYWGIIGIDPGPRRLPFLGRLGLLFAVMPFHAFFGIATMTMTTSIGEQFYRNLELPWVSSLSDDQHVGGAIAWGSSEVPVLIVVVALVAQWARQDRRAGVRQDRHADIGYDDDLDAYNAMLAQLARDRR